jgi:hypothetical protein
MEMKVTRFSVVVAVWTAVLVAGAYAIGVSNLNTSMLNTSPQPKERVAALTALPGQTIKEN